MKERKVKFVSIDIGYPYRLFNMDMSTDFTRNLAQKEKNVNFLITNINLNSDIDY